MPSILVVDDSASIRQMVSFTLKQKGYSVTEACDGKEGYDKVMGSRFDLIFTDQNMPRISGLEFITKVRGQGIKTPILMLTTENSQAMKEKGKAAGANGWLVKPFNPDQLVTIVKKLTG